MGTQTLAGHSDVIVEENMKISHRRLRQLGYKGEFACIKMASWRNAACQYSHWVMSNFWFDGLGV